MLSVGGCSVPSSTEDPWGKAPWPAKWVLSVAAAGNAWPRSCDGLVMARPDDGTAKGKYGKAMPSQINVLPHLCVGN